MHEKLVVYGIQSASHVQIAGISDGGLVQPLIKSDPGAPDEACGPQHSKHLPHVSPDNDDMTAGKCLFPRLFPFCRFFIGFTWNVAINLVMKTLSAVPRPHFIATCNPDWTLIDCDQFKG